MLPRDEIASIVACFLFRILLASVSCVKNLVACFWFLHFLVAGNVMSHHPLTSCMSSHHVINLTDSTPTVANYFGRNKAGYWPVPATREKPIRVSTLFKSLF